MKALTLHQPYATLIAEGIKTIETRSWKPPHNVIGERIAIHAGQTVDRDCQLWVDIEKLFASVHEPMLEQRIQNAPTGVIVCTARLLSVQIVVEIDEMGFVATDEATGLVDDWGDYSRGRFLYFLEDIQKVNPPIEVRGKQRFWELPNEIERELHQYE